jgi:3-isopropylmalate dehydratase small subunit
VVRGLDGREIAFTVPAERRTALLAGLDEIDVILGIESEIEAFQRVDREQRPWVYLDRA